MVQKNHALISRFQKDACFIKIVYAYDHVVRELQEGRIGGHLDKIRPFFLRPFLWWKITSFGLVRRRMLGRLNSINEHVKQEKVYSKIQGHIHHYQIHSKLGKD